MGMKLPLHILRKVPRAKTTNVAVKPQRAARGKGRTGLAKAAKCRACAERSTVNVASAGQLLVLIPIKVETEGKAKGHWRPRYKRKMSQQAAVNLYVKPHQLPPLPVVVTFTRYGKRLLDTDNLVSSFGHVRDQVAALYGCGDGPRDPITWAEPKQDIAAEYSVVIDIVSAPAPTLPPPGRKVPKAEARAAAIKQFDGTLAMLAPAPTEPQ